MMVIATTKGDQFKVDDDYYPLLSVLKWHTAVPSKSRPNAKRYAYTLFYSRDKSCRILLHSLIMGGTKVVDHIDGDTSNNQRSNLRACTASQNSANRGPMPNTSSQYKGVTKYGRYKDGTQRWLSQIVYNNKHYHLGFYRDEKEAARAYDKASLKFWGDFGYQNGV